MTRRYAEGTSVPVESSRGEITGILTKHGCETMAWGSKPEGDLLQFELGGKSFRFDIPRPNLDEVRTMVRKDGRNPGLVRDWSALVAAEWRRRWRARVLLIKAKLEFIEAGDSTLETEFLPYLLLRDGRTAGQLIQDGGLPLLTAGGEKR